MALGAANRTDRGGGAGAREAIKAGRGLREGKGPRGAVTTLGVGLLLREGTALADGAGGLSLEPLEKPGPASGTEGRAPRGSVAGLAFGAIRTIIYAVTGPRRAGTTGLGRIQCKITRLAGGTGRALLVDGDHPVPTG